MIEELEQRRADIERHKENSARSASSYAKFHTEGQGFLEFGKRVDFGLTFVEEPYAQYCGQVDLDNLEDMLNREAEAGTNPPPVPNISGVVTSWDIDDRGFYTGCWVGVRVHYPAEDLVPLDFKVPIDHHFTFTAIAFKDVPLEVRD